MQSKVVTASWDGLIKLWVSRPLALKQSRTLNTLPVGLIIVCTMYHYAHNIFSRFPPCGVAWTSWKRMVPVSRCFPLPFLFVMSVMKMSAPLSGPDLSYRSILQLSAMFAPNRHPACGPHLTPDKGLAM